MCKNFLSLEDSLEIGFFICRNSNMAQNIPWIVYESLEFSVSSVQQFCELTATLYQYAFIVFRIRCSGTCGPLSSSEPYWMKGYVQYQNPYNNLGEYDVSGCVISHIFNSSSIYYGYITGYNASTVEVSWNKFNF